MGLWDNCVAADDVYAALGRLGFVAHPPSDTESTIAFRSGDVFAFVKRPNVFGKIALIYVESVFDEAGLEQPDWILVSCES